MCLSKNRKNYCQVTQSVPIWYSLWNFKGIQNGISMGRGAISRIFDEKNFDFTFEFIFRLTKGLFSEILFKSKIDWNHKFRDHFSSPLVYFEPPHWIFCKDYVRNHLKYHLQSLRFQFLAFKICLGRCTYFSWLHYPLGRRQRNAL